MSDDISIIINEARGYETILIADDQRMIRDVLETVFRTTGYNVITARDGQDAVDKFKDNIDSIDIILMDVVMPRKDGVEAYKEICKIKPSVKIVFMSGYTTNDLDELKPNIDLVLKPFMPSALVNRIRKTLDGVCQCGCP